MKIIIMALIGFSPFAFSQSKNSIAAELYMRALVRESAANAGSSVMAYCSKFEQRLAGDTMTRSIVGDGIWAHSSSSDRNSFKRKYLLYLATKARERITSSTSVGQVNVEGSGSNMVITAQIQGGSGGAVTYWVAGNSSVLNSISADDLNALSNEFKGRGKASGNVAAKLFSAFHIYRFRVQGTDVVQYMHDEYAMYVQNALGGRQVLDNNFWAQKGVNGSCP